MIAKEERRKNVRKRSEKKINYNRLKIMNNQLKYKWENNDVIIK